MAEIGTCTASRDRQWGAVGEHRQRGHVVAVVGACPALQPVGIGQQRGSAQQLLPTASHDAALATISARGR
ncbi:MAG: hypothetical protein ACRDUV_06145 [Pseudonocardiaceae bacterium]